MNGGYPVDTKASFSCNRGYALSKTTYRICQTYGRWNELSPTCNQSNGKLTFSKIFSDSTSKQIEILVLFFRISKSQRSVGFDRYGMLFFLNYYNSKFADNSYFR